MSQITHTKLRQQVVERALRSKYGLRGGLPSVPKYVVVLACDDPVPNVK